MVNTAASTSTMPYKVTDEQMKRFREDGYVVLPNFFTDDVAGKLLARAKQLLADFDLKDHPMRTRTRFTTGSDDKHVGDDYFLDSGDKIRFFFENEAFDPDGKLTRPKDEAINKIAHCLHSLDDVYRDFTFSESVRAVVKALNLHRKPVIPQSMIICKQPRIGGQVPIHDDDTFLHTEPASAVGFWFPMEDCTLAPTDNGCLSFVPGSHLRNPSTKRFVRLPQGGTGFVPVEGGAKEETDWSKDRWRTEEVKKGSCVLIDGKVIHKSESNRSDRSRFIYTFHAIEGDLPYPSDNWLQPTSAMPFTPLFA